MREGVGAFLRLITRAAAVATRQAAACLAVEARMVPCELEFLTTNAIPALTSGLRAHRPLGCQMAHVLGFNRNVWGLRGCQSGCNYNSPPGTMNYYKCEAGLKGWVAGAEEGGTERRTGSKPPVAVLCV